MSIYDIDCELGCKLLKAERNKIEAVKALCVPEADKGVLSTRGRKKLAIDILKILGAEG